ncbi:MAG TPA: ABC transporter ATP-binding protein [Thermoanaerobaculia bacterium]|nr:ABC transporter ATP-binding protein [Thermoanaerobaculia bacterium]
MAAELEARFVRRFRGGPAIQADLVLPGDDGPVTVLFGPSGSGKTTVLRALAGLDRPDEGTIVHGHETWLDAGRRVFVPARQRRIGLLFQDYALFPHLTAHENVAFGLHGVGSAERERRTIETLALLRLESLGSRRPSELSGGQRQRVALARAIAPSPRLLLLDEPLSALDGPTREELRVELRALLLRLGVPAVVVTHDRIEALALGDRMAVMVDGRIRQHDRVADVFERPADRDVARCVGVDTVLAGRVVGTGEGLVIVEAHGLRLAAVDRGLGGDVWVLLRAEDVILERGGTARSSARNHLPGRVTAVTPEGPLVRVAISCGNARLSALVTRASRTDLGLEEGVEVVAVVKAPSIHLVPRA